MAAQMGMQSPDDTTVSANRSAAVCQTKPRLIARDEPTNLKLLSDQALQDRITHYRIQMEAAMKLGMKPEAHRNRLHFEAALRERNSRPHLVAALERAQAARMTREPGATRDA